MFGFKDREDVRRVNSFEFIIGDDVLDTGFDFDGEKLSGFVSGVDDIALLDIGFFEVCDVDESHPTGIEAEEKHIASESERSGMLEVEMDEFGEDVLVNGAFTCTVDTGIDVTEGEGLFGETDTDSFVVDRAQDTHIERDRVTNDTFSKKEVVVTFDEESSKFIEID